MTLGQRPYRFAVKFTDVSGLQIGAPVRFRGMTVGKVAGLRPQPDGVAVTLEIASTQLLIPRNSVVQAARYGLIGEGSIEISPPGPLPQEAVSLSPFPPKCNPKLIICDGDELSGASGSQLVESLTDLGQSLGKLDIDNINESIANVKIAASRIVKLSDEFSLLAKSSRQEIQGLSDTLKAIEQAGNQATQLGNHLDRLIVKNEESVNRSLQDTAKLIHSLNTLIAENRGNTARTVASIARTSEELGTLAAKMQVTVDEVNTTLAIADKEKIVKNIESLLANAAETSANLKQISASLNDPATLLSLQETLNSARATFANAQKITADVDELTGDPAFRKNIRQLINGLSGLLSSGYELQQQVQTAQVLGSVSQQLEYQIDIYQKLAAYQGRQESGGRSQESGGRSQESGVRSQEAGVRRQEAGVRSQESGGRRQEAGVRSQESGVRSQEAGVRRQESGVRGQEAGGRKQEAGVISSPVK
jgi:phospholipid/cholesterol/gamma-HCH transport system substrate-binding protein